MQRSGSRRLVMFIALATFAACKDDPAGSGGDALVFANSSGSEVNVDLTLPDGSSLNVTLPASISARETRVNVSFVEGDVYRFTLYSISPSIQSSLEITCTVGAQAVQDGVAAILVFLDFAVGSLTGECLTNWAESF